MAPRLKNFVLRATTGDPISCLHLAKDPKGDFAILAGSQFGLVWCYRAGHKVRISLNSKEEDSCQALYVKDDKIYALLGDCVQKEFLFAADGTIQRACDDRRRKPSAGQHRFILQRGNKLLVLNSSHSAGPASVTNTYDMLHPVDPPVGSMFKVQPTKATPCDFDGRRLLLLDHNGDETKARVLYLQTNTCLFEKTFGRARFGLFRCQDQSKKGASCMPNNKCTHAKFFGEGSIAFVVGFRTIWLARLQGGGNNDDTDELLYTCQADVVALDASDPTRIAALSNDGRVYVFSKVGDSVKLIRTCHFKGCSFSLGYPYLVTSSGEACSISSDEGVWFCKQMKRAGDADVPAIGNLGESPGPTPVMADGPQVSVSASKPPQTSFTATPAEPALSSDLSAPAPDGKKFDPPPRAHDAVERTNSASKPINTSSVAQSSSSSLHTNSAPVQPKVAPAVRPTAIQLAQMAISTQDVAEEPSGGSSSQPTSNVTSGFSGGGYVVTAEKFSTATTAEKFHSISSTVKEDTGEISAEGDLSPVKPKDAPPAWGYTTPKNSPEYIAEVQAQRERSWSS